MKNHHRIDKLDQVISRRAASQERVSLLRRMRGCDVCGFSVMNVLHVHHIRPVSEGGLGAKDNLALLCPNCHSIVHLIRKQGDFIFRDEGNLEALRVGTNYTEAQLEYLIVIARGVTDET